MRLLLLALLLLASCGGASTTARDLVREERDARVAREYEEEHFDVGGAQTLAEWRMREHAARLRWVDADRALTDAKGH